MKELVKVEGLKKYFIRRSKDLSERVIKAVDDVSLKIKPGEVFGLVGESGCGKTTLARTILWLIEPTNGKVFFQDKDIFSAGGEELKQIRRNMQIIFQDPFSSLNPRMRIGDIVAEGLLIHRIGTKKERREMASKILKEVGLLEDAIDRYPHEFSGGQRQRIGIARALILRPKFVVCDEPVSSLDVSIQTQILNLLLDLKDKYGLSYLFISHNLSVVYYVSDRVAVMYKGQIVECAPSEELYRNPVHPYTRELLDASKFVVSSGIEKPEPLPSGCIYYPRCSYSSAFEEKCISRPPDYFFVNPGHFVKCYIAQQFTS